MVMIPFDETNGMATHITHIKIIFIFLFFYKNERLCVTNIKGKFKTHDLLQPFISSV